MILTLGLLLKLEDNMGSDKHKKSHDKKEKKSEKSERHHRHSEKSHKKDRKKDRKEDKELPLKSIIDQPISNDDYFAKSQEFRVWLKLQLNL